MEMEETKEAEEQTIEIEQVEEVKEVDQRETIEELREDGISDEEIEMHKEHGLIKEESKEEVSKEKESGEEAEESDPHETFSETDIMLSIYSGEIKDEEVGMKKCQRGIKRLFRILMVDQINSL